MSRSRSRASRRFAANRMTGIVLVAGLAAVVLASIAACGGGGTDPCLPALPGVVAYRSGIDLLVRDAAGRGEAIGDTSITVRGTDTSNAIGSDTLHLAAGFAMPGTFSVRVKRQFYRDAVVPNVTVPAAQCGGPVTQQVPVTLELAPGAPALRSIAILGAGFLASPGAQTQLVARFDADPSVPTTVAWRLSDSSAARIDASGLVTAKCTTKSVVDTVTAVAAADTTVRSRGLSQVAQQASCP